MNGPVGCQTQGSENVPSPEHYPRNSEIRSPQSDVMDMADYDASVCANNTAFKFPPKDKDGGVVDPYSVTLENLDEIRGIRPTKAGT